MCKEDSIMTYSTVTSKGQVTIPKAVRERMGITEGSRLVFVDDGDRILVYRIEPDLESLYGAVKHEGPPIDFKRLKEEVAVEIARGAMAGSGAGGTAAEPAAADQAGQRKAADRTGKTRAAKAPKKVP